MERVLEGKDIVVTGGRGGLGGAVVDLLVTAGARCHLPLREAKVEARDGVVATTGVDLTDEGSVTAFYATLPPLWGSVHLAGGFAGRPILETGLSDLRQQLDVNLITAFLCAREAVRNMRRAPGRGGRIVNVSSRAALVPAGGSIAYSVAKAGVSLLTATLAEEVKADGILVNAIAPSIIDTAANRAAMPKAAHDRWPRPEQVARTILWLVSSDNALTSGATIPVYGV
jgi:NAD(P)-dependent dehydrogenase (short-subunit alcohol dehydrogenase family)